MQLFPFVINAQENNDDTITAKIKDSIALVLDSIVPPYTDTSDEAIISPAEEDYEDEAYKDTLFFLRKEDTASLFDSSVIQWRAVPDSTVKALKNDEAFWYANKDMEKKKDPESDSWIDRFLFALLRLFGNALFSQILWIIIIGAFAAAIIWFLVQNKMNIFSSTRVPIIAHNKREGEVDNIFTTDLKAAIADAALKENYRLAIRFSYLHLLKTFSENGLLQYRNDATNMEYLTQLYNRPYYRHFFKVTRDYEYVWYGKTYVSKEQYNSVQHEFSELYDKTALIY